MKELSPFIIPRKCNNPKYIGFNCCTSNNPCDKGWRGKNCESMIHRCDDKPCLNGGVCQPIPHGYECKCLGDSYSGRHCEIIGKKIFILKIVSKSFAYIAIIVMSSAAMFVVIMDILKYCFGIDPVQEERERIRRKHPADQQLIIVNTALNPFEKPLSTIQATTV